MHGEVCATCVEATMLKQLPQLKRALEDLYGATLDRWLATGRLQNAQCVVNPNVQLSPERLKSFIREIVREAVAQGDIALQLESGEGWKPIQIYQLMDTLFEQCG